MAPWAAPPHHEEAAYPHVVGKQGDLGGVVDAHVGIGVHGVHVLGHDDAQGSHHGQVDGQLGVPRGGEHFVEALVAFAGEGAFVGFQDLFNGVADAPVGAVHVAGHDKEHGNGQVVVGLIG